ncbi:MAG TPA: RagB/SusD family nutrient uptake outer membrane protein [Ohtaekwangia sp.]|uniref:RagB/SusD family nutrient uptake outer membrane protein n=1 Tax=Ohtaekwangia sp. TaxID=2066019 RepID=UPI002F95CAE3
MKKLLYIAGLAFGIFSCNVLEENPQSFISPVNFYKTKSDALAALTAAYNPVQQNGFVSRNYVILGEIPTDNMFPLSNNADRVQLDNYVQTPQNVVVRETWQDFFLGITRSNIVIDRVPLISMDETLRNRIVAEAKFLRGFYYFQLVRLFGEVPLITHEVASLDQLTYPQRSSVEDVYQQIITDFTDAEAVLPATYGSADLGRATKGAAKAFLASVYLTRKEYAKVLEKTTELMNPSSGYGLWAEYKDVFLIANEYGKEYIFDVNYVGGASGGQGGGLIAFFAQENNPVQGRGFGSFQPTPELYSSFDPADKRLPVYFTKGTDNKYYCNKWVDATSLTANTSGNNYPLMRFAEVVLAHAEAYNKLNQPVDGNEAYEAVNSIRRRAGLPDLAGLTQDALHAAILNERRLELCFEGQRWFDLVRTDTFLPVLTGKGYAATQKDMLMPVPQFEIDLNTSLKPQNTGYPQ